MCTTHYNGKVPAALHRQIGQLAVVGFDGTTFRAEVRALAREFDLGGVILFARNVGIAGAGGRPRRRGAAARAGPAAVGRRRSGRRPRGAAEAPVHRVAADGDARAGRRRGAGRRGSRRRWRASWRGRHLDRLRAGARRADQPEEPGHRRPRARRDGRTSSRGSARPSSRALQEGGVAACGKHFPGPRRHERSTRTSTCRSSSIRPSGCATSSSCRSGRRSRRASPAIMTAHLLVPALRRGEPGDPVAAHRDRAAAGGAGLRRPRLHRRPRHEGDRGADCRASARSCRPSRPGATSCCCAAPTARPGGGARGAGARGRAGGDPCTRRWRTRWRASGARRSASRRSRDRPAPRLAADAAARELRSVVGCEAHQVVAERDAAVRDDAEAARAPTRRPRRRRRAGEPVPARGVRRRRRRARAARVRAGLRPIACSTAQRLRGGAAETRAPRPSRARLADESVARA